MTGAKADIIAQLQRDILPLQGFKKALNNTVADAGLGIIKNSFPNQVFPVGAVHEFISAGSEDAAATSGFVSGLLSSLMHKNGAAIWISASRTIFPPALRLFGIAPDKIIFIDPPKEKEMLWVMEEALKCKGLSAVIGEIPQLTFTASRRLQLAVEQSQVTGFILRNNPLNLNTTTCVTRWKITSLPSQIPHNMPGVGFPRWDVELLKVRNGTPGKWHIEFSGGRFRHISKLKAIALEPQKKQDDMHRRFASIWFHHLKTDWFIRLKPSLKQVPFVLAAADHGRRVITAANLLAEKEGVFAGMAVADARAAIPALEVLDDKPEYANKLLNGLAEWFIRYTPCVAIDLPDSLILDVTGCAHLWGGEKQYLTEIIKRLRTFGYNIHGTIADTIGTAWAVSHFKGSTIVEPGKQISALQSLPPAALRIDIDTSARLEKLGLRQISGFINMSRPALRRRFGMQLLKRLDQALDHEEESIIPVQPIEPYQERLPCLEPIVTATGIEIALQKLLEALCLRLQKEGKGLRAGSFKSYRIDGKVEKIEIGTNRPSCNTKHLFKLFGIKIDSIEPALGIELFTIDATKLEDVSTVQENLWDSPGGLDEINLSELLDRIDGKIGPNHIHRFVPDEHYWPERSFKLASSINEKPLTAWIVERPRPLQMLYRPQLIEVTAPIPDYPPMSFRYKGKYHKIIKADGPERIEQEWWLQQGQHRDYYTVEDEEGKRYWLFRSGHYDTAKSYQWFIHGFFA